MPRPHQLDGGSSAPAVPPTLLIVDSTSSWERTEALVESAGRRLGGAADFLRQVGWTSAELPVVTVLVQGTTGWKKGSDGHRGGSWGKIVTERVRIEDLEFGGGVVDE